MQSLPRWLISAAVPALLKPSPFVDRYKALPFPSNCEKITILNITPLEAEVHFFFEHDLKADTFILDPPSMTLKPNEKQVGGERAAMQHPGAALPAHQTSLLSLFGARN